MKLWVDDEREPPGTEWKWVQTVVAGLIRICNIEEWDAVTELSLDHDFGAGQPTGYDLLYCMGRLGLKVPKIIVHSQNPDGKQAMEAFIERMELEG